MSAKKALDNYYKKQLPKAKRKNKAPEKDVEKEVMVWLRENGFSCHVVEAKSSWSKKHNRYIIQSVVPGFPDITGCSSKGVSVWIELKALGKRSTLSNDQREFLHEKIGKGAFAVCVDNVDLLSSLWRAFKEHGQPQVLLEQSLPKEPVRRVKPIDPEFGF